MYICELCPRQCRVDREEKRGYCGMGIQPKIARAALHFWEEPCISGCRGSGTVFFSGCTLRCAYCQNYPISHEGQGKEISVSQLADIFKMLEDQGAHNINLVTGTPFVPAILEALSIYKPGIPLLWNCGGYEKMETLKMLEGAIDIYLPDFKHVSPRLAQLCAGAPDYFEVTSAAIAEMCRQTSTPQYDENGIMKKGTLIRHLILPGCTMDSCKVLSHIAENLPKGTPVSLMRQYSPEPWCKIKGLDRRVSDAEYERVLSHYQMLELDGYTQDKESADTAYTPLFDLTGIK